MTAQDTKKHDRVTFSHVSPDELRFDPANPRFAAGGHAKSQEHIQKLLEEEPHLALGLVDSFLENGFIPYEPLVVRRDGRHYIVVEGNRRLAAIRHILANPDKYAKRSTQIEQLKEIPVLVFPQLGGDSDQKQQRIYLGVRHLFGFRDWPAESKARFLDSQIRQKPDLERLRRELNIKRAEIRRYLIPYRLRKGAQALWDPYAEQDFWVLGEALNRGGIKEYIELDIDSATLQIRSFAHPKLKNVLEYIYGVPEGSRRASKRIGETRDLSKLSKVLQSKRAAAMLERGRSLEEALLFIETAGQSVSRLERSLRELRVLLKNVLSKQIKDADSRENLLKKFDAFDQAAREFIKHAK